MQQCVPATLQSLHRQHREYQNYKQLIKLWLPYSCKRQSSLLAQYIASCGAISKQFENELFGVFLLHLQQFQRTLQGQYTLLKQHGKDFYVVKDEGQRILKDSSRQVKEAEKRVFKARKALVSAQDQRGYLNEFKMDKTVQATKLSEELKRVESDFEKRQSQLEDVQQFWQNQQQALLERIRLSSQRSTDLIGETNCAVQEFLARHKFVQCCSQKSSAKKSAGLGGERSSTNSKCSQRTKYSITQVTPFSLYSEQEVRVKSDYMDDNSELNNQFK